MTCGQILYFQNCCCQTHFNHLTTSYEEFVTKVKILKTKAAERTN